MTVLPLSTKSIILLWKVIKLGKHDFLLVNPCSPCPIIFIFKPVIWSPEYHWSSRTPVASVGHIFQLFAFKEGKTWVDHEPHELPQQVVSSQHRGTVRCKSVAATVKPDAPLEHISLNLTEGKKKKSWGKQDRF